VTDQDKQPVDLHQLTARLGTLHPVQRGKSGGNGLFVVATIAPAKCAQHTHVTIEGPFSAYLLDRALTAALAVLAGGGK